MSCHLRMWTTRYGTRNVAPILHADLAEKGELPYRPLGTVRGAGGIEAPLRDPVCPVDTSSNGVGCMELCGLSPGVRPDPGARFNKRSFIDLSNGCHRAGLTAPPKHLHERSSTCGESYPGRPAQMQF